MYPKTPSEKDEMSHISYVSVVKSLMYVMLCTRSDTCFIVGIVSRFQLNPGRHHRKAVKAILEYLRKTKDMMLMYG